MELKDFVQTTIEQIVEGVSEAQKSVTKLNATINPSKMEYYEKGSTNIYNHPLPQIVEFDIALESISKSGGTEGIGVFLGSINLGKKNDKSAENTSLSKVKFTVPLVLPSGGSIVEDNT